MDKHTTNIRRCRLSRAAARSVDRAAILLVLIAPTIGVAVAIADALAGQQLDRANLLIFLALWAGTLFGIEAGYHRYFAHRSYRTGPAFETVLALLGSMAFQGPVLWWAALHRQHHKHTDRPGDPHSPHVDGRALRGLLDAHVMWLFREVDGISRKSRWAPFVPDLLENRLMLWLHRRYLWWLALGLALPTAAGGLANGSLHGAYVGFIWGGLVRIFLVNHAIWAVNSVCHFYGTRPFALYARDRSTNNFWVAMLSMGAGWHHNHHVFPGSATTQIRPWELDLSGLLLRLLARVGVVHELRRPPRNAGSAAWRRRVVAHALGEFADSPVVITNLTPTRAFVETTQSYPVGSSVVLYDIRVSDGGAPLHIIDIAAVNAIVDYASCQGVGVRLFAPESEATRAFTRLAQRRAAS